MDDLTTIPVARDDEQAPTTGSYPTVTVAMVAHNPGAWFDDVLGSLVAQDYPAIEVVVIDAASDVPVTAAVHEAIPEAVVVPLVANQGFAKNANVILDHGTLGPYLLILHDDVALAPDCVRRLMEEALRSNAGVIGPKLLDWNDPTRILHVGLGADKTGLVADLAEPGEYDQEQHDAVRDVFAVPGAVTLLRTDLFRALDGFDEAMKVRGEDLDLCWRAHALGARVMVNPAATARHREDLTTRIVGADDDRFARRHRIRSMLSNYGPLHTLRVVPQALGASLVNAIIALLQGRVRLIGEIFGAWFWNLRRLPSIVSRRRQLSRIRQVHDREVRALQLPGFEGLNAWRRTRADRHEPDAADDAAAPARTQAQRSRSMQAAAVVWVGVIGVILFGSRFLITDGVPLFNEFVAFPDGPSSLFAEWSSTWRSTGVGAEGPSSLLHAIVGFVGVGLFGQMGFVQLLLVVGLVVVGPIGAWRLLSPFGSLQAQIVAVVVYAAVPLPYNALYEGSWSALVAYAAMPFVVRRMATAASVAPFADDEPTWGRSLGDVVALSLMLSAAALIEPAIVAAPLLFAVTWVIGSLASRRVRRAGRVIAVALSSVVGAFVLSMPASLGLFSADAVWSSVAGSARLGGDGLGVARLFRLATGPHGENAFGWVLLVVPALALVLASGPRFAWAVRCWVTAIMSVGLVVAIERSVIDVSMPSATVLLAPAGLSLAFAAGITAVAFGSDLRRYRFGWRQFVPFVAVGALGVSSIVGIGGALDGRWQMVDDGYGDVFEFLDERAPAHARALWLGDDAVLPVQGWRFDDRLTYGITQARTPTVLDIAIGNPSPEVLALRADFDRSLSGSGNRLGRTLAGYGVRYVIVVESNAPEPFGTIDRPIDAGLADRLTEQLDLVRVQVRNGATIYENRSYVPTVSSFAPAALVDGVDTNLAYELALPEVTSLRSYRGPIGPADLYVAVPSETNWQLTVDGERIAPATSGWATVFESDRAGNAVLAHSNEFAPWLGVIVQLFSWFGLVVLLVLARRRRS